MASESPPRDRPLTGIATRWAAMRRFAAAASALWWAVAAPPVRAADPPPAVGEYVLKAAFMFNFSQFVEWPADAFAEPDAKFQICVLGKDPFGASIKALERRTHKSRAIAVQFPATAMEARKCHMLYVDNPTDIAPSLIKALGDAPVLTVSSHENSLDMGIAIGFVQRGEKLRWTLNLDAARRARVKMSAKLIEIATEVRGSAGP